MRETVAVYRPGEGVFDRDTGGVVEGPPEVEFYTGKARVKGEATQGSEVRAGEHNVTLRSYIVSLPWGAVLPAGERPRPGDVIDVTASPEARLVGLRLWVDEVTYGSTTTAWRIRAEDRS